VVYNLTLKITGIRRKAFYLVGEGIIGQTQKNHIGAVDRLLVALRVMLYSQFSCNGFGPLLVPTRKRDHCITGVIENLRQSSTDSPGSDNTDFLICYQCITHASLVS
jgi:hypothetical protein